MNATARAGASLLAEPNAVCNAPKGSKNVPPGATICSASWLMAVRTCPSTT
jgi:hypothetical protein